MATQKPTEDTEASEGTQSAKGYRILKHGMLVGPTNAVCLDARPGQFGKIDLAFDLDGQKFILPVSPKSPQYAALENAYGKPSGWGGKTMRLSEGTVIRQMNVAPL